MPLAVLLLAAVVAAQHVCLTTVCPAEFGCIETTKGAGCCPYMQGALCGEENCCPSGWRCHGQTCVSGGEEIPAKALMLEKELQCSAAEERLKTAVKAVAERTDLMALLDAVEAVVAGKEACGKHTEKLQFSPGSCMVDFLLLETDTRVTFMSLFSGDVGSAFSALLNVLVWAPYVRADCLA